LCEIALNLGLGDHGPRRVGLLREGEGDSLVVAKLEAEGDPTVGVGPPAEVEGAVRGGLPVQADLAVGKDAGHLAERRGDHSDTGLSARAGGEVREVRDVGDDDPEGVLASVSALADGLPGHRSGGGVVLEAGDVRW
jgi:hypothetical protein